MQTQHIAASKQVQAKAAELGLSTDAFACALHILAQNKDLVNAIDYRMEMDEYIYRAIIKQAVDQRKEEAERNADHPDERLHLQAEKDLAMLSREELMTDPFYRAALPLLVKIVVNEPILRLHADTASDVVMGLADFKRRHRATSVTEIIVTKCRSEIESLHNSNSVLT